MTDGQLQRQVMDMAMPALCSMDGIENAEGSSTPAEPRAGRHQLQGVLPLTQAGVFPGGFPLAFQHPHQHLVRQQAHSPLLQTDRNPRQNSQQQG